MEKLKKFFDDIRNILQKDFVHFIFIGPQGLYRDTVSSNRRVKGVFIDTPVILKPLSKTDLAQTVLKRMQILSHDKYIKPFNEELLFKLYDIYNGDIRTIFNSLSNLINSQPHPKTLTLDEAITLISTDIWSKLDMNGLTDTEKKIINTAARLKQEFQQKEISDKLDIAGSNMSNYFKKLESQGIISLVETKGKDKSIKHQQLSML